MKKHLLKVLTLLMAAAVLLCACGDGKNAADSGAQESWQKQLISKDKLAVSYTHLDVYKRQGHQRDLVSRC